MRCLLFIPQRARTRKPWWKTTKKPWSRFSAYGYRFCVFKHGIHGDRPRIPDGMPESIDPLPLEFFVNLGCPLAQTAVEAKAAEVHPVERTKDLVEGTIAEEQG